MNCANMKCINRRIESASNCELCLDENDCNRHMTLTKKSDTGAKLACSGGLNDLRTDFAKIAIKDIELRIDSRIQAYDDGISILSREQLDDYEHDACLLLLLRGI